MCFSGAWGQIQLINNRKSPAAGKLVLLALVEEKNPKEDSLRYGCMRQYLTLKLTLTPSSDAFMFLCSDWRVLSRRWLQTIEKPTAGQQVVKLLFWHSTETKKKPCRPSAILSVCLSPPVSLSEMSTLASWREATTSKDLWWGKWFFKEIRSWVRVRLQFVCSRLRLVTICC